MDTQSLSQLREPDRRALIFTPFGLSTRGPAEAELIAEYQQQVVARADLSVDVPEATRRAFERVRRLHAHGVLFYDAYTLANELAPFVLDLALRERFLAYYSHHVTLVHAARSKVVDGKSFEQFREALVKSNRQLRAGPGDGRRWKLEHRPGKRMKFSGSFKHLLDWARNVGLLYGQRNRAVERATRDFRNHTAHPSGYGLQGPVQSARRIRDTAEMINRLWDAATPGGRLYPEPVEREPIAIGWGGDDGSRTALLADPDRPDMDESKTYLVIRAAWGDPDLHSFDAQFERTTYPADLLFGPSTWQDAREWLRDNGPSRDHVDYLDRLFLVRETREGVELPRRPTVAAALPEEQRTGTWHLMRADYPTDAYGHVRGPGGTPDEACSQAGPCGNCHVEVVAHGSWHQVAEDLDVEPTHIPDVRVPPLW